jgi:hypothetical protein
MDLQAIVENLIQEHGIEGAIEKVTEGKLVAQRNGDNYQLSVWREVKGILTDRWQLTETSPGK